MPVYLLILNALSYAVSIAFFYRHLDLQGWIILGIAGFIALGTAGSFLKKNV